MTILHKIADAPAALIAVFITLWLIGCLAGNYQSERRRESVIYHGRPEIRIGLLIHLISATFVLVSGALVVLMLTSCTTAPKPHQIPLQAEPVQAQKTTIRTWLDFFEPRD